MNLQITRPNICGKFRTHELVFRDDPKTSCDAVHLHENELPGRDIVCDEGGLWRAFESADGFVIDAGPLVHRGETVETPTYIHSF
jgi:ribonuclease Z